MQIDSKLSKAAYFADFFVIPPAVVLCFIFAFMYGDASLAWPVWFAAGVGAWMAFEYFLHRFFLHGPYKKQHWLHHIRPSEYIAVSTAFTFLAFFITWLLFSSVAGAMKNFSLGQMAFAGFYSAYFGYRYTHNALHQWSDARLQSSRWFKPLHDAHEIHHKGGPYNFGVQTMALDRLFGTFKK